MARKQSTEPRRKKLTPAERSRRVSEGMKLAWAFRKSRGQKWKKVP